MAKEYVLGTDNTELTRLKRQHELWKGELLKIWQQSQFQAGDRLLDLGCGPGFTTQDLARWLGPKSHITAVDMAENFIEHLKNLPIENSSAKIEALVSNLATMDLPNKGHFDGAFCRWLMIFVPNPKDALKKVFEHLKPGAKFSLQEYVAYDTMALCPDSKIMNTVVEKIFESWRAEGGDPNRGKDLPYLLSEVGFDVLSIQPVAQSIRPQDSMWEWPDGFYESYIPRLVQKKYLTEKQAHDFFDDWHRASTVPGHFFMAPTVVNIIAQKPTKK